jgi:hypothetical protein
MSEENKSNQQSESDLSVSFSGRAEYIPGLILEQIIQIRALLAASFTLQLELLSHLTGSDPDTTRADYVQRLGELTLEFARDAEDSLKKQPPLE